MRSLLKCQHFRRAASSCARAISGSRVPSGPNVIPHKRDQRIKAIMVDISDERMNSTYTELLDEFRCFLDSRGTIEAQLRLDDYFRRDNPHHFIQYMNAGTEGLFNMMLACTGLYARRQYLQLSASRENLERLSDSLYLPSRAEIMETFQLEISSKTTKASQFSSLFKSDDWDSLFTVESFMDHVLVCCVLRDGGFKRYNLPTALGHFVYCRRGCTEIYTKEYIDSLAAELAALQQQSEHKKAILEIGAGDGVLAYLLNKTGKLSPSYIHATDSKPVKVDKDDLEETFFSQYTPSIVDQMLNVKGFKREIVNMPTPFPVEKLDYEEAISRYKPDIVLCSWKPSGEDWFSFPSEEPLKLIHIGDAGRSGTFNKYCNIDDIRLPISDHQISSCDYSKVAGWCTTIVVDKVEGY